MSALHIITNRTKRVTYEWDLEKGHWDHEVDGSLIWECDDHDHRDAFPGIPTDGRRLVLVRDDWRTGERSWAYVDGGRLPKYFENAYGEKTSKVPARFHSELFSKRFQ